MPRPTAGGAHPGPGEGTADGGSADSGGAENGVCKMDDLEYMKEGYVQKFGLSLKFRGLLQHQAKQKKRVSDGSKEHQVHYLDKTGQ